MKELLIECPVIYGTGGGLCYAVGKKHATVPKKPREATMNKRQAKREAYFWASEWLFDKLRSGLDWSNSDYEPDEVEKIEKAISEIAHEIKSRGER